MSSARADIERLQGDLAWRMLATHGAPVAAEPILTWAVDPECTLIATSMCARHDPRCAELALWYGISFHNVLTTQRARRLTQRVGPSAQAALAAFGATARANDLSDLRGWWPKEGVEVSVGWRINFDAGRLTDKLGQPFGAGAALQQAGAITLRTRMAIGPGARAESLAMLLVESAFWRGRDEGWLSLSKLEAGTGYNKRFLLDTLPGMAQAGLLRHRREGRSHEFAAAPLLAEAIGAVARVWGSWPRKLQALEEIRRAVVALDESRTMSTAMDELRRLSKVAPVFEGYQPPRDPDAVPDVFEAFCLNAARAIVLDVK